MRTLIRGLMHRRSLTLALVLIFVAVACGSDGETTIEPGGSPDPDPPRGDPFDGRQFWSTVVTIDGADHQLAPDTRVHVRFDEGHVGIDAGCNNMGGPYEVDGNRLVVAELGMTAMGCGPARHEQDEFIADLFQSRPSIDLDGDVLTIATESTVIEFLDRDVADPDRPLVGTRWEITGFFDSQVATAYAVEVSGWLLFETDSTLSGFDGCNSIQLPVEISESSGELQIGSAGDPLPSADCDAAQDYASAVTRVLGAGSATFTIDGPNLSIETANGDGITLRADG